MTEFKIEISLDKARFFDKKEGSIIYLTRDSKNFTDNFIFDKNKIIAIGSRTKKINKNMLETSNSTYFSLIVKALLHAYFSYGEFKVLSITVYLNGNEFINYSKEDIQQVFEVPPTIKVDTSKLFLQKKTSDFIMISLMNLTLSFNTSDIKFDYCWKCFNSLIRGIFNQKKDFEMLKSVKSDLEENPQKYNTVISYIKNNVDIDYVKKCDISSMIQNNFSDKNTKNLPSFFKSFEDHRATKVLLQIMQTSEKNIDAIEYKTIEAHYQNSLQKKQINHIDIVRLLILRYAYYLRCQYFHAERSPSNFLLNNSNKSELDRISIPVMLICKDLIES